MKPFSDAAFRPIKEERVEAAQVTSIPRPSQPSPGDKAAFIEDVRRALYCSKIVSYAQGYMLLQEAAKERVESQLRRHRAHVARRLHHPQPVPRQDQGSLRQESVAPQPAARRFLQPDAEQIPGLLARRIIRAIEYGVPTPAFSTALSFYDGYRTARLPANLLQAQRDFFGAHTYERVDQPRGKFFHTNWTGRGGRVSRTYNA